MPKATGQAAYLKSLLDVNDEDRGRVPGKGIGNFEKQAILILLDDPNLCTQLRGLGIVVVARVRYHFAVFIDIHAHAHG